VTPAGPDPSATSARSAPRRVWLVGAAGVALLAGIATPGSASASTHGERRVCTAASDGYASCDAHVRTAGGGTAPDASTTYTSGYSPAQLTSAYGISGSGAPLVAVVDAYASPTAANDLAAYRAQFGLGTAALTQVNQTGGTAWPAGDTGWGQEEALDLDMVSAACPGCSILYVGAASSSFADLSAAVATAKSKGAKVISNSYGGSEFNGEQNQSAFFATPGVVITVSSGDSGYGTQFPAAAAGVVAVGGTSLTLTATGTRASETVWSGAGSGCSAYVAKPSWQHDAGCAKRTVADVAAVADPNTGVAVYDSYGSTGGANWLVFGGTSVAAPLVGGIYAREGVPSSAPASTYAATTGLFDVTSGSNGGCVKGKSTTTAYLCTGTVGYDGPTGLGAPNGLGAF